MTPTLEFGTFLEAVPAKIPDMQQELWELYNSDDNSKNLMGKGELTWIELSMPSSVLGLFYRFSYLMFHSLWCQYSKPYFPEKEAETLLHLRSLLKGTTP